MTAETLTRTEEAAVWILKVVRRTECSVLTIYRRGASMTAVPTSMSETIGRPSFEGAAIASIRELRHGCEQSRDTMVYGLLGDARREDVRRRCVYSVWVLSPRNMTTP